MTLNYATLNGFTGSETIYQQPMFKTKYTEGVKFLGDSVNWLLTDILAQLDYNPKLRGNSFVAIKIKPAIGQIVYTDGDDTEIEIQEYGIMDGLDNQRINLFATDGVLMLAREY